MVNLSTALLFSSLALVPATAGNDSIIIRHDRADARYLELGARFPAVAKLGGRMGDGTLISDRWVLTAAHVARGMRDRDRGVVRIGDTEYRVSEFYLHPDWRDMGPHDIALLKLDRPVTGVEPLALYRGNGELDRAAVLVGHGGTGTGDSRERAEDGQRRGATNIIDEVNDRYIVFTFDAPPSGTDLEGIPGPGDSGGPALIQVDGAWLVAGVSSLGEPGQNGPGSYGARDYFGRVSNHLKWLDDVMGGRIAVSVAPAASSELPDSPSGRRLEALLSLAASGPDDAAIEAFLRGNLAQSRLEGMNVAESVARWRKVLEPLASAEVVRVMIKGDHQTDVLLKTAEGRSLLGVRVEAKEPHGIERLFTGRP